ncbi:hypothetical protein DB347_24330 [Opitutaceae bacterium EW11]|nr:hypothetical protein DB347_24330 [Opitutaceae bacterium EW11]
MDRSREKVTIGLLVLSLAMLVVLAGAAYRTIEAFQRSRAELLQSRERLREAAELVSTLRRLVGDVRGYVIAGREEYVSGMPAAIEELRIRTRTLKVQVEDNTAGSRFVAEFEPLLEQRIARLNETVALRRERGKSAAEEFGSTGQGRDMDNAIARRVSEFRAVEDSAVAARMARLDRHARVTFVLLALAVAGNVVLVTVIAVVLRRELRKREEISARLETEAEQARVVSADLQRSQQLFMRLFENSPDALVLVDADRRIARANARAHELFGWTSGTLDGQLLDLLLPERFRARHLAHMAAYFKAPKARPMGQGLDLFGLRSGGDEFPVDIMLSPMGGDTSPLVLAVIRDITQRKQAQQHIERLNEDLQRRAVDLEYANKELEAFSYSVSHDLRAPLRHINGFSDMLKAHAANMLDEKGRRYLDTIVDAAKRMGVLIDDLLMFSRMGRSEMVRQPVNLAVLAEEAKRAVEDEASSRNIRWSIASLPEVQGDVAMLRQVLFNLVSNAVKYTRARSEALIEIGTAPSSPGEVVCFVKDNGAGFDMKYAHKLFGVFQRLHGSAEFEGTGVGLAIVRRIVQRHGGRAWAEGALDQGATFYFSLPANGT